MNRLSAYWCFLILALAAAGGAAAENAQTIGVNSDLSAGSRALQFGNFSEGIRLTLEGLRSESSPRSRARAHSNLCAGYTAMRRYGEAIEHCDRALEINDRNWRTYNNRALALLGMGRIAAARRDLEKGLSLNPGSPSLTKVARLIDQGSPLAGIPVQS
jgi:tetratricopeptide (TPR) repeat protein